MLLDQSDLTIGQLPLDLRSANSESEKNAILVHTSLSSLRTSLPPFSVDTLSLVDTGSTAAAFADDETIAKKYDFPVNQLVRPKPLRLADGVPSSFITHYFAARMTIGRHSEPMLFYITKLSPRTPIILGMPWLRKHNPRLDFANLGLIFDSTYCSRHCLPFNASTQQRFAPLGKHPTPRLRYRQPSVEDAPDDGNCPDYSRQAELAEDWTVPPPPPTPAAQTPTIINTKTSGNPEPRKPKTPHPLHPGRPIRHPSLYHVPFVPTLARVTEEISMTQETRAIETTAQARPTSTPLPARVVQSRRLPPAAPRRVALALFPSEQKDHAPILTIFDASALLISFSFVDKKT